MLHTDALELLQQTPRTPRTPRTKFAVSRPAAARRQDRSLLLRLLLGALFVAFLTGSNSYRMHMAIRREQGMEGAAWLATEEGEAPLFSSLRNWLDGGSAGRRSLREGPPGASSQAAAAEAAARDVATIGVQLHENWYLLGVHGSSRSAAAAAQQEQDGGEDTPLLAPAAKKRQQTAVRLYNLATQAWVHRHNLTKFPSEVPVAQWAAASLHNKAKHKESVIFLLGGHMSASEAAAGRPPRPKPAVAIKRAASPSTACPQASAGVFSINPGRGKVRALPPLPQARYGGSAVVLGARLHYLGGFATDKSSRLATPSASHWSIGLNADGSSAPEWQKEASLPPPLLGAPSVLALTPEEATGEPGIYAWTASSSSSSSLDAACYADAAAAAAAGVRDRGGSSSSSQGQQPRQLWFYNSSTGWQERGKLPQPLADDVQCAVAATPHQLVAVGAVERSGLFSRERGIWQYEAHGGGTWMRAGWAPVEFVGPLCAMHNGRLFISSALPAVEATAEAAEAAAAEEEEAEDEAAAAAAAAAEPEAEAEAEEAAAEA